MLKPTADAVMTTPIFSTAGARPVGDRSKRCSSQWDPHRRRATHAADCQPHLSEQLEKAARYPGLEIIAKLATVLELASWGLRCLPGTASDWERSAALYPINQPRFAAGQ